MTQNKNKINGYKFEVENCICTDLKDHKLKHMIAPKSKDDCVILIRGNKIIIDSNQKESDCFIVKPLDTAIRIDPKLKFIDVIDYY